MTRPVRVARLAAAFTLLTILTGIFAQGFVAGRLIDMGDAAKTAANLSANRGLHQAAFAVFMVEMACNVTATVLFYVLLKPVHRTAALVSLALGLTGTTLKTLGRVFFIAPLFVLPGRGLDALAAGQLQALALVFLRIDDWAAAMGLVFFGFSGVLQGWLMLRAWFLPRWIGVISLLSGAGWLTFLYRPLASKAFPVVLAIGLLGALATILWLLVKGVNERRWRDQAGEAV
jgi:hypothetical protein